MCFRAVSLTFPLKLPCVFTPFCDTSVAPLLRTSVNGVVELLRLFTRAAMGSTGAALANVLRKRGGEVVSWFRLRVSHSL